MTQTSVSNTGISARGPLTSGSLASHLGAELIGPADLPITGVETLERAGETHLAFIRSAKFADGLAASKARVAIVGPDFKMAHDQAAKAVLVVKNVDVALSVALDLLKPEETPRPAGVHPTAVVDPSATVAPTAHIGPRCIVEAGAVIEDHVTLVANVFVGRGTRIGAGTLIYANVTLYARCRVGRQCILHAGVVLGADGFGYLPDPARGLVKIPHIGDVVLGDAVEVGANSCIDRGKFGSTTVGSGTKIDNLVQIGHNCVIGRSAVLCGQVGIGGSTVIGDGAMLGGQVGVSDHLNVGPMAKIGAGSGVLESVPAKMSYIGYPARPSPETLRHWGWMRQFRQKNRTEAADTKATRDAQDEAAIPGTGRWTLSGPAHLSGVGIFTGKPASVTIHPSETGGLRVRTPAGERPLDIGAVPTDGARLPFPTGVQARNTTLVFGDTIVATVEHVVSALAGLGVTDAVIELAGPEIPILDGSARPIVSAIVAAGLRKLSGRVDPITLTAPITVSRGDATIVATPRPQPGLSYTYVIDYGDAIPRASVTWLGDSTKYAAEIAPARTFCLASEAKALRERGMFTHVTTKEMLVLDERTGEPIENKLLFPDEPARHKLLDLIGDLALLGRPLQADVVATRSGHSLAHDFCRTVLAR